MLKMGYVCINLIKSFIEVALHQAHAIKKLAPIYCLHEKLEGLERKCLHALFSSFEGLVVESHTPLLLLDLFILQSLKK